MLHRSSLAFAVLAGALGFSRPAASAEPVAIVATLHGGVQGAQALDYLTPKTVIHLDAKGRIIIDYLTSCIRERITGGTVTVGASQSSVAGGQVQRERVDCDSISRQRQGASSNTPGFVAPSWKEGQPRETGIQRTIYGLSPLFDVGPGGELVIEPIDPKGNSIRVDLSSSNLRRGRFYDCAQTKLALAPGGVYRATAHGRSIVFWVDPLAQPGASPIAGRLLKL